MFQELYNELKGPVVATRSCLASISSGFGYGRIKPQRDFKGITSGVIDKLSTLPFDGTPAFIEPFEINSINVLDGLALPGMNMHFIKDKGVCILNPNSSAFIQTNRVLENFVIPANLFKLIFAQWNRQIIHHENMDFLVFHDRSFLANMVHVNKVAEAVMRMPFEAFGSFTIPSANNITSALRDLGDAFGYHPKNSYTPIVVKLGPKTGKILAGKKPLTSFLSATPEFSFSINLNEVISLFMKFEGKEVSISKRPDNNAILLEVDNVSFSAGITYKEGDS